MNLSARKAYLAMLTVTGLVGLATVAALFTCVSILRSYSDKLVAVKLENQILEEKQSSLKAASKAIEAYSELDKIARAVVPQDKDQAASVRTISTIASDFGIQLSAITFPPSTLGQASTTKKSSKTAETQVTPVPGLSKVYELQITVQSSTSNPISYETFLDFLAKLEANRRTAQVSSITILPNAADRTKITFNLVLGTYIRP